MTEDPGAALTRALEAAAGGAGLLQAARRFGIEGFVRRHRSADPPPASSPRNGRRLASRLSEIVLLETAAEVSEALAARDVPHFVAKGVAFLGVLYQPGDREVADVDLWVHPDVVSAALEALTGLGFVEAGADRQGGPRGLRPGRLFLRGASDTPLTAVALDLHWGLEAVTRIIPRAGPPLLRDVWHSLDRNGSFPVPGPAHHAALLVHHLVHHDLLHVRGLLDLALLWRRRPIEPAPFERAARHLGVWRAARLITQVLARDLGVAGAAQVASAPGDWRGRRVARLVALPHWFAWTLRAPEEEHYEMTRQRFFRRCLLLDRVRDVMGLGADAVWPPEAHVRWRWPAAPNALAARWRHARHVFGKLRVYRNGRDLVHTTMTPQAALDPANSPGTSPAPR